MPFSIARVYHRAIGGELAMREAGTFRVWLVATLLMCVGCFGRAIAAQEELGTTQSDYVIGPGDTLEIQVRNHPELSAEAIVVRPDGYIGLPIYHQEQPVESGTNDAAAAGLTVGELGSRLSRKFALEVVVVVKEKESCRVFKAASGQEQPTVFASGCLSGAAYRIATGDVLQIDVWKQPEITRAVLVQPDGTIRLPLVDGVKISGRTPMELATLLREKLLHFLNKPQVTVTVVEMHRTFAPTRQPTAPILPQRAPQMRDTPPLKCCIA
jgi:protein involved in polysaccharide export with SLBB domain